MNNYENAEPKILKTLNSSGEVLDDSGNVIADTSDYWVKTYNQAEPKPDKILHSDGTIKDSAGNLIQDTTAFNVTKYNQAEPIPAKYLHADGTIDENSGSGGADLEDNKTATIDVSTYTEPVEIEPSEGKDGMKKTTVSLENIPKNKIYCWKNLNSAGLNVSRIFLEKDIIEDSEDFNECYAIGVTMVNYGLAKAKMKNWYPSMQFVEKTSDSSFVVKINGTDNTYTREPSGDIILW